MTSPIRSLAPFVLGAVWFGCTAGVQMAAQDAGGGGAGGGTQPDAADTAMDRPPSIEVNNDLPTASEPMACATSSVMAELTPLDLYVMVDVSKSMARPTTAGPSKWDAVKSAMNTFFSDPQSSGLGVGLGYFPALQPTLLTVPTCLTDGQCGATFGPCDRRKTCVSTTSTTTVVTPLCLDNTTCAASQTCALIQDCGEPNFCAAGGAGPTCPTPACKEFAGYCHARDICDSAVYATPVVPIAPLAGSAAGQAATLAASLGQRAPDGYTPTAPALKGAIQYARQYAQANPGHKLAVVLVTDGLPLGFTDIFDTGTGTIKPGFPRAECNPIDIPGIAAIAASGAAPTAGMAAVPTFVIGVSSPAEAAVIGGMLNEIATGGRTAPAVLIDTSQDVSQMLRAKLAEIRTKAIACEYKIPSPTGSGSVDFRKVNVDFKGGNGNVTTIGRVVAGKAACDARGGWYYDVAPEADAGAPTSITACPATCDMFQTDTNGQVQIVLGCMTIVVE